MSAPMLIAELYNGSKGEPKCWLKINRLENNRRSLVEQLGVSGKREARQIAQQRGAKVWNF